MGLFKKKKDQAADAAAAAAAAAGQGGDGMVHVEGAGAVDPAILGGPSTKSVAADDPIWEPIEGVTLEQYAKITKASADQGITDEAGLYAFAETQGVSADAMKAAAAGWTERMKQSQAVGQQFNKIYMGR